MLIIFKLNNCQNLNHFHKMPVGARRVPAAGRPTAKPSNQLSCGQGGVEVARAGPWVFQVDERMPARSLGRLQRQREDSPSNPAGGAHLGLADVERMQVRSHGKYAI